MLLEVGGCCRKTRFFDFFSAVDAYVDTFGNFGGPAAGEGPAGFSSLAQIFHEVTRRACRSKSDSVVRGNWAQLGVNFTG